MYQTLIDVQRTEAVGVLKYIDNRMGSNLHVGLRSITYTVGWDNVGSSEIFSWHYNDGLTNTLEVVPGLWSFNRLKDLVDNPGIGLLVSKVNGLVTLLVLIGWKVQFTAGLLTLLGIDDSGWLDAGTYTGERPVNFAPTKTLHVHLEQVNTTHNALDGAPSTFLGVVGVGCNSYGEIETVVVPHPEFKCLLCGTKDELKVPVRDDTGQRIENHDLPIYVVVEIR